jgi:UDP-N-acetylmuramyl pentapeptide phosphotransferase/UDP-N-acetylglucosamine-1-phosphate transferase
VVWLVGVTNFFNFMDGIDGLASGQAIVVCLGVAASGWSGDSSLIALVVVGALLGFLPFNWSPSRIFLGDVGSLPVGFLLAGLPLLAPLPDRSRAVFAVALSLTLFLLDPVLTLWRRWRRGAPLGQAHREHLYQQFLDPGDLHVGVTSIFICAGLGLTAIGWLVYRWPFLGWPGAVVAVLAFGIEHRLAQPRPGR